MQRRDTPNCPSTRREDVHGAVAQRAWYCLPGQALPWAMDPAGAYTVCSGHGSQREAGARSLRWTAPWGPHHPSHRWYERVRWRGAALPAGPVCGLALVEGFDDGRLLAPLRVFDRHEPPGFDVSAHLKGLGLLPRCLRCFCFPFRHVRSPQKSVLTMPRGTPLLLGKIWGNLSKKDASSPGVGHTCRRGGGGDRDCRARCGVLATSRVRDRTPVSS